MEKQGLPGILVYPPAQTNECPSLRSQKIVLFGVFLPFAVLGKIHFRKKGEELFFPPAKIMLLSLLQLYMYMMLSCLF